MLSFFSAVSGFIIAVSILLAVLFLHRIANPLKAALTMCAIRATGKKLSSLVRVAKDGSTLLPSADQIVQAALEPADDLGPQIFQSAHSPAFSVAVSYEMQPKRPAETGPHRCPASELGQD